MLLKLKVNRSEVRTSSFSVVDRGWGGGGLTVVFGTATDSFRDNQAELVGAQLELTMPEFDALYAEAHKNNEAMLDLTPYAPECLVR